MKRHYSKIVFIFLSLIFLSSAQAQNEKLTKKLSKQALVAFSNQNYNKALRLYSKLDSLNPSTHEYDYMLGMCYLSSPQKAKALPYLESAKVKGGTSFVIYYYLGRAYLLANRNDEALFAFQVYADNLAALKDFRFSKPRVVNESNRVHMEKTMDDINLFISMCGVTGKDYSDLSFNTK